MIWSWKVGLEIVSWHADSAISWTSPSTNCSWIILGRNSWKQRVFCIGQAWMEDWKIELQKKSFSSIPKIVPFSVYKIHIFLCTKCLFTFWNMVLWAHSDSWRHLGRQAEISKLVCLLGCTCVQWNIGSWLWPVCVLTCPNNGSWLRPVCVLTCPNKCSSQTLVHYLDYSNI